MKLNLCVNATSTRHAFNASMTWAIRSWHHQSLRSWILCLYLIGLNLSNLQIAPELDLNPDDALWMTTQLRSGIAANKPTVCLAGVECDEVYVIAGHKGNQKSSKKGRTGRRRRLKSKAGRGTLARRSPDFRVDSTSRRSSQDASQRKASHDCATTQKPALCLELLSILTNTSSILLYPSGGYDHKSVCHGKESMHAGGWRRILRSPCQYYGRLGRYCGLGSDHTEVFSREVASISGQLHLVHNTRNE